MRMSGDQKTGLFLSRYPRSFHPPRSGKGGRTERRGQGPELAKGRGNGITIRRTIQTRRKTAQCNYKLIDRAGNLALNPRSARALAVLDRENPLIVPRTTTKRRLRRRRVQKNEILDNPISYLNLSINRPFLDSGSENRIVGFRDPACPPTRAL